MTTTRTAKLLLIALAALSPALAGAGVEPQPEATEEKRVIKIKTVSGPHRESHVTVSGADGESLRMAHPFLRTRGYLGVSLLDITPELRAHFGAPDDAGVLISRVEEDSPAARAGLLAGDVLVALDGEPVTSRFGLMRQIVRSETGEAIGLEVIRDGRTLALEAVLGERPRAQVDLAPMVWGWKEGKEIELPTLESFDIEIDEESLTELRQRLDSPGLRHHIERFGERHETLEKRLRELEEKLRELEAELEKTRE